MQGRGPESSQRGERWELDPEGPCLVLGCPAWMAVPGQLVIAPEEDFKSHQEGSPQQGLCLLTPNGEEDLRILNWPGSLGRFPVCVGYFIIMTLWFLALNHHLLASTLRSTITILAITAKSSVVASLNCVVMLETPSPARPDGHGKRCALPVKHSPLVSLRPQVSTSVCPLSDPHERFSQGGSWQYQYISFTM